MLGCRLKLSQYAVATPAELLRLQHWTVQPNFVLRRLIQTATGTKRVFWRALRSSPPPQNSNGLPQWHPKTGPSRLRQHPTTRPSKLRRHPATQLSRLSSNGDTYPRKVSVLTRVAVSLGLGPAYRKALNKIRGRRKALAVLSPSWLTALAELRAPYDGRQQSTPRSEKRSVEEGIMIRNWLKVPRRLKSLRWKSTMIKALDTSYRDALMILLHCLKRDTFRPPGYQIDDCLELITHKSLEHSGVPTPEVVDTMCQCVHHFLHKYRLATNRSSINQRVIFFLSKYCTIEQFNLFFALLQKRRVDIRLSSKLALINRFIDICNIRAIWSILKTITRAEFDLDRVQVVCSRLLREDFDVENIYAVRSIILAEMLQMGLRPNRHLYNVILLNAMEAKDFYTGWRIHQIARDHGLRPDCYTYTILLKSTDDMASIEAIQTSALNDGIDSREPRFASALFLSTCLSEEIKSQSSTFEAVLPHYKEYFKVQPIVDLGLLEQSKTSIEADNEKLEPDPPDLGLLLLTYLKQPENTDWVEALYNNYRHLLSARHPVISRLAETTHTANAFLMALGRNPRTLHLCTSVLTDIMKLDVSSSNPSKANLLQSNEDMNEELRICPPDVQTWSILVHAYLRHGQAAAAEKVIQVMRDRGMMPDQVTWNTLVAGYMRMQNMEKAVKSLRRMEGAGFAPDTFTLTSLGKMTNGQNLVRALERVMKKEGRKGGEVVGNKISLLGGE